MFRFLLVAALCFFVPGEARRSLSPNIGLRESMGQVAQGLPIAQVRRGSGDQSAESPPAVDAKSPAIPRRKAKILFDYTRRQESSYAIKSLGQLYHYGKDVEIRNLQGMIILDVPDVDFLQSVTVPANPAHPWTQVPRLTAWNYVGPNSLLGQEDGPPNLDIGYDCRVVRYTGHAEYSRTQERNDYNLAEHSKSQLRWYKTVTKTHGAKPLPPDGRDTNWQTAFDSQNGMGFFRYTLLPIPVTIEENADGKVSSEQGAEGAEVVVPPKEHEEDWDLSRRLDARRVLVVGSRERDQTDGHVRESLQVSIDLDPADYECVITPPDDYRDWIPEGGHNEAEVGSTLKFTGEIRCIKGNPSLDRQFQVNVELNSSTQPGVCVNFPAHGAKTADLGILRQGTSPELELKSNQGSGHDDAWTMATGNLKLDQKFTVVVGCYDYGAFGNVAFGGEVPVRIEGFDDRQALDVPLDENHNHIADAWEHGSKAWADPDADDDNLPAGNGVDGDGLSVYEEYRGFVCCGAYVRTSPWQKDLFIHDPGNLGCGLFPLSKITVHFVRVGEFAEEDGAKNKFVINCNRANATQGPQHLLYLRNLALEGGIVGYAELTEFGPPKQTAYVDVDVAKCNTLGPLRLVSTTAHELAHGCNVRHHGDINYSARDVKYHGEDDAWHDYPNGAGDSGWTVAVQGGQHSGVENCIMRYMVASFYARADGPFAWREVDGGRYIQGELYPDKPFSRTLFCDAKKGTGINAEDYPGGPVAGDASVGDCMHQLQINDHKPPKVP